MMQINFYVQTGGSYHFDNCRCVWHPNLLGTKGYVVVVVVFGRVPP